MVLVRTIVSQSVAADGGDGRGYSMSEGKWHWKAQSDSKCPRFESLREAA